MYHKEWDFVGFSGTCWRRSGWLGKLSDAGDRLTKRYCLSICNFWFGVLVSCKFWFLFVFNLCNFLYKKKKGNFLFNFFFWVCLGNLERQMALIARIQHPYIVEFKEAWVEKVRNCQNYSLVMLLYSVLVTFSIFFFSLL